MVQFLDAKINSFSYGTEKVLYDTNLFINKGEILLLTGSSGSGKTTLLRLLNGLIPSFYDGSLDGSIELLGKNINEYKKGELAKYFGNVFQNPKDQFFCDVVEDEIALVGENLGINRDELLKRVDNAIDLLNISNLRKKSIFHLSGGERQKVAIAGTLIYGTEIIFFDEPSSSLDHESIEGFKRILKKLKEIGKTIIIAEHRIYYLKDLFDRLVYLKDHTIDRIYKNGEITHEMCKELGLRTLEERVLIGERNKAIERSLINVDNIDIYQGKRCLIQDLSFELKENEVMGIVGYNGTGKTTLAESLCGLIGKKINVSYGQRKKDRVKNSYLVLQDVDSQIFLDSVENELLSCGNSENTDFLSELKRYLNETDLWNQRVYHPQKLSGGQKQRLAIITSFLSMRKLIVLDEPTSGLDYKNMCNISELIIEKSQEVPFIIITHDLELLFKTCNSVLILEKNYCRKIDLKGNEKMIFEFIDRNKFYNEKQSIKRSRLY